MISAGPTLSDSNFRSRPEFKQYLRSDNNAGPNHLRQIELRRLARHMKFPRLTGRRDVDSFQADITKDIAFKKYNDEGDHRVNAPNRDNVTLIDPVSGFVAVGADVDRNTGRSRIKTMVQLNNTQQSIPPPQQQTLVRNHEHAPPELRRAHTIANHTPTAWDSKLLSDAQIRSNLGGWTSDKDPRKESNKSDLPGSMPACMPTTDEDQKNTVRNKMAHNYVWKTSTERSYAEVPWDKVLPVKIYPADTTLEPRPDMISQRYTLKRYNPTAQDWQSVGRAWDWFQTRHNYKDHRPADFCEHLPRGGQIPGYSGCIGAENVVDDRDNRQIAFQPFTVKRNAQPWYTDTAARPDIPMYTGCTLYRSKTDVPGGATTSSVHRSLPVQAPTHIRESHMSKMIRTVPPNNPFNQVKKPEVTS